MGVVIKKGPTQTSTGRPEPVPQIQNLPASRTAGLNPAIAVDYAKKPSLDDAKVPTGHALEGRRVTISHDFPKEYKVCKKGDQGVIAKINGNLCKIRLDSPKTDTDEPWLYLTQVEVHDGQSA